MHICITKFRFTQTQKYTFRYLDRILNGSDELLVNRCVTGQMGTWTQPWTSYRWLPVHVPTAGSQAGSLSNWSVNWDPTSEAQQISEAYLELLSQLKKNPITKSREVIEEKRGHQGTKSDNVQRQARGKLAAAPELKSRPSGYMHS